jgi:hypothetical protein
MCPIGFLMLGSTLQDLPSDSPAACRSACRRRRASPRTGSHQRTILACTRPSWSATRSSWPLPNHLPTTTARSKPTPRLAQHRLRQLRDEAPTQADDEPVMDAAATTPTPAIPAIRRPAHAALQDLTSAGHSARGNAQTPDAGQRTPDSGHRTADTGQRTPGRSDARTGHWTPVTWTGKRGHWSLAPDTGHRTLAEDADR